jgi:D-alanine-D-alanine ligase
MKRKISVLFNNQVLKSAASVINAIDKEKYEVIPIGITKKGRWFFYPGPCINIENATWEDDTDCVPAVISPDNIHRGILKLENNEVVYKKIDLVFSLLPMKGPIQGLLEMTKIPFVGSSVAVTVVCSDNAFTHAILEYSNVKTAKWKVITQRRISELDSECEKLSSNLNFPLFVKPANSNEGFNKATDIHSLKDCIKQAFLHDSKIVVEEFIEGRELEVAVLSYEEELIVSFVRDKNDINFPIEADIAEEARNIAVRAVKTLGVKDYAIVRLFLTEDEILLDEVDTQPCLYEKGHFSVLMDELGVSYEHLINKLIALNL